MELQMEGADVFRMGSNKIKEDFNMNSLDRVSLRHYFINLKILVSASYTVLASLWENCVILITTLLEADNKFQILLADPKKRQEMIIDPENIPQKMTKKGNIS